MSNSEESDRDGDSSDELDVCLKVMNMIDLLRKIRKELTFEIPAGKMKYSRG